MFNFLKSNKDNSDINEAQASTTETQQSYTDIWDKWKALAASREITKEDIAALCIYRSMIKGEGKEGAISRLRKSFTPISNLVKIENGAAPYFSLSEAIFFSKNSKLASWLAEDERKQLITITRDIKILGKEIK